MVSAAAYCNGDDVFLAWTLPRTDDCWGVAIWRDRKPSAGDAVGEYLHNFTGFAGDDVTPGEHRPSAEWPFQRYTWTDHGVGEGDTVSYTITPMLKTAQGLRPDAHAQAAVGPLKVTVRAGGISAYFNRGFLLSQFMARRLGPNFTKADLLKVKKELEQSTDDLRAFLTGQLGARVLELLDEAKTNGWHVFAALYELDDPALVERLKALGEKAHLVLSNGSKKKKGEDGNARAAGELDGVVDLHRRMLWGEGLGHNKFLVLAKSQAKPTAVWTGSTNWATTGLCTQLNNAVLIENEALARVYLEQWKRLRDDHYLDAHGNERHFAPALVASNDEPKLTSGSQRTVWFTRTSAGQDLDAATALINGATEAILFLMFEPGSSGLLQVVQARLSPASPHFQPELYVHGVVNTLRRVGAGENVTVDLVSRGESKPFELKVVQPEGISDLPGWATEVTRRDFLLGQGGVIGHAIVHSKVVVLDPFTKPVVITGSHNFSLPASNANDENLLIVKGNSALAQRYAVNIMSSYQHYRWRAYLLQCLQEHRSPWRGLVKSADWQAKHAEHNRELTFWVRPDGT